MTRVRMCVYWREERKGEGKEEREEKEKGEEVLAWSFNSLCLA